MHGQAVDESGQPCEKRRMGEPVRPGQPFTQKPDEYDAVEETAAARRHESTPSNRIAAPLIPDEASSSASNRPAAGSEDLDAPDHGGKAPRAGGQCPAL